MKDSERYSYLVLAALALLSGEPLHERIEHPTVVYSTAPLAGSLTYSCSLSLPKGLRVRVLTS